MKKEFKVGQRVWVKEHRESGVVTAVEMTTVGGKNVPYYRLDSGFNYLAEQLHQTADDMFKELGYEEDNDIKNERIIYKREDSLEIIFSLKEKEVWLERIGDTSGEYILEINEHLAIHQKLIELGEIE